MALRRSLRPSKQLLWILFSHDMKNSSHFEVGLDLACGPMGNREYFKTKKYTGIDVDETGIEQGLKRFPDVDYRIGTIEDLPDETKGDFVVCVQTIGINTEFETSHTIKCIKAMVRSVNQGGTLIFNVAGESLTNNELAIDKIISTHFRSSKKTEYGNFSDQTTRLKSLVLARLMYYLPYLRKGGTKYAYYVCNEKA